jgi:hypothetical protein
MEDPRITHNRRVPLWFHLTISASAGIEIVACRAKLNFAQIAALRKAG